MPSAPLREFLRDRKWGRQQEERPRNPVATTAFAPIVPPTWCSFVGAVTTISGSAGLIMRPWLAATSIGSVLIVFAAVLERGIFLPEEREVRHYPAATLLGPDPGDRLEL